LYGLLNFARLSHENLLGLSREFTVMKVFSVQIINALANALKQERNEASKSRATLSQFTRSLSPSTSA
jgi:hypothetical protein